MSHYHVGHNMPGYLPESDVDIARTKGEAIELLKGRKRMFLDHDYEGELRVYGNARDLYYDTNFGIVIWADECFYDCPLEEEL